MQFEIQAGAKIEVATPDEVKGIVGNWFRELNRGVKFRRAGGQTNKAGAVFSIGRDSKAGDFGPAAGFVWSVLNIAVKGAAYKAGTDTFDVYYNEQSPNTVWATALSRQVSYDVGTLVLNPDDSLFVAGAATDPGNEVSVTLFVAEVPVQLAWQLL